MELLGEILHFSKSGRLIAKIKNNNLNSIIGSTIADNGQRKIGKISELLGPVDSPYASVIPFVQKKSKLVGSQVFLLRNSNKKHHNKNSKKFQIKRNKK
jgi:RNA-binding protein